MAMAEFKSKTDEIYRGLPITKKLVGLGQIVYTEQPENYNFLGIGTCLGVYMYDLIQGSYLMAHTMLSKYCENHSKLTNDALARYTDVAIRLMIKKLLKKGSRRENIQCKIVGGAKIYNDNLNIGEDNIKCAKLILKEENIELVAEDTGGNTSRSILDFYPDGRLHIRKNGKHYDI